MRLCTRRARASKLRYQNVRTKTSSEARMATSTCLPKVLALGWKEWMIAITEYFSVPAAGECVGVGNVAGLTSLVDVSSTLSLPLPIRDINADSYLVNSRIKVASHGSGKEPGINTIDPLIGPEVRQRHPEPNLLFFLYIR